jgi:hypothetical protein
MVMKCKLFTREVIAATVLHDKNRFSVFECARFFPFLLDRRVHLIPSRAQESISIECYGMNFFKYFFVGMPNLIRSSYPILKIK